MCGASLILRCSALHSEVPRAALCGLMSACGPSAGAEGGQAQVRQGASWPPVLQRHSWAASSPPSAAGTLCGRLVSASDHPGRGLVYASSQFGRGLGGSADCLPRVPPDEERGPSRHLQQRLRELSRCRSGNPASMSLEGFLPSDIYTISHRISEVLMNAPISSLGISSLGMSPPWADRSDWWRFASFQHMRIG